MGLPIDVLTAERVQYGERITVLEQEVKVLKAEKMHDTELIAKLSRELEQFKSQSAPSGRGRK